MKNSQQPIQDETVNLQLEGKLSRPAKFIRSTHLTSKTPKTGRELHKYKTETIKEHSNIRRIVSKVGSRYSDGSILTIKHRKDKICKKQVLNFLLDKTENPKERFCHTCRKKLDAKGTTFSKLNNNIKEIGFTEDNSCTVEDYNLRILNCQGDDVGKRISYRQKQIKSQTQGKQVLPKVHDIKDGESSKKFINLKKEKLNRPEQDDVSSNSFSVSYENKHKSQRGNDSIKNDYHNIDLKRSNKHLGGMKNRANSYRFPLHQTLNEPMNSYKSRSSEVLITISRSNSENSMVKLLPKKSLIDQPNCYPKHIKVNTIQLNSDRLLDSLAEIEISSENFQNNKKEKHETCQRNGEEIKIKSGYESFIRKQGRETLNLVKEESASLTGIENQLQRNRSEKRKQRNKEYKNNTEREKLHCKMSKESRREEQMVSLNYIVNCGKRILESTPLTILKKIPEFILNRNRINSNIELNEPKKFRYTKSYNVLHSSKKKVTRTEKMKDMLDDYDNKLRVRVLNAHSSWYNWKNKKRKYNDKNVNYYPRYSPQVVTGEGEGDIFMKSLERRDDQNEIKVHHPTDGIGDPERRISKKHLKHNEKSLLFGESRSHHQEISEQDSSIPKLQNKLIKPNNDQNADNQPLDNKTKKHIEGFINNKEFLIKPKMKYDLESRSDSSIIPSEPEMDTYKMPRRQENKISKNRNSTQNHDLGNKIKEEFATNHRGELLANEKEMASISKHKNHLHEGRSRQKHSNHNHYIETKKTDLPDKVISDESNENYTRGEDPKNEQQRFTKLYNNNKLSNDKVMDMYRRPNNYKNERSSRKNHYQQNRHIEHIINENPKHLEDFQTINKNVEHKNNLHHTTGNRNEVDNYRKLKYNENEDNSEQKHYHQKNNLDQQRNEQVNKKREEEYQTSYPKGELKRNHNETMKYSIIKERDENEINEYKPKRHENVDSLTKKPSHHNDYLNLKINEQQNKQKLEDSHSYYQKVEPKSHNRQAEELKHRQINYEHKTDRHSEYKEGKPLLINKHNSRKDMKKQDSLWRSTAKLRVNTEYSKYGQQGLHETLLERNLRRNNCRAQRRHHTADGSHQFKDKDVHKSNNKISHKSCSRQHLNNKTQIGTKEKDYRPKKKSVEDHILEKNKPYQQKSERNFQKYENNSYKQKMEHKKTDFLRKRSHTENSRNPNKKIENRSGQSENRKHVPENRSLGRKIQSKQSSVGDLQAISSQNMKIKLPEPPKSAIVNSSKAQKLLNKKNKKVTFAD